MNEIFTRCSSRVFCLSADFTSKHRKKKLDADDFSYERKVRENNNKTRLRRAKKILIGQKFLSNLFRKNNEENIKLHNLYKLKLLRDSRVKEHFNKAAVFIQKLFKGWLTRIKLEKTLVQAQRNYLQKMLKITEEQTEKCFYIGKNLQIFANRIQKAVKSFLMKRKHSRILDGLRKSLKNIRLLLRFLVIKEKNYVRNEEQRNLKLQKIRKNLALHVISNALSPKKEGIKFKKQARRSSAADFSPKSRASRSKKKTGFTIKELSDSESVNESHNYFNFCFGSNTNSTMRGIPILIQKKRVSRIWVKKYDSETNNYFYEHNTQGSVTINNSLTTTRRNSVFSSRLSIPVSQPDNE